MKTILFLAYDLPYPLDSGGKIRAYHMIRQLSAFYKVRLIYFYRRNRNIIHEKQLSPFCEKIIPFKRRPVSSFKTISYLSLMPYPAALYFDPQILDQIDREISAGVDIVHAESFYTSMFVTKKKSIPYILGTENIEWLVYSDFAHQYKNSLVKALLQFEINRIKRFEISTWRSADALLAVSDENKNEISKNSDRPVYLIKNGVDVDYFSKVTGNGKSKTLLFVGNFNYIQNQDAVLFLIKDILPLIPKDFSLRIVGRNPSSELKQLVQYANKDLKHPIILDSEVEDIRDAYSNAGILLAPLRTGSGTKFKILEAMACGLPVITTPIGAEGINGTHEQDILIVEKPDQMVHFIEKIDRDKSYRERISRNAKKVILKNYSWELIGESLLHAYERTLYNYRKL